MAQSSAFRDRLGVLFRAIFPEPMVRIPSRHDLERCRQDAALAIVARQAEGNVLLSAGRINMTGVDFIRRRRSTASMPRVVRSEYEGAIQEISDLYNTAEADLKTVGTERNELIVAGVNQLRYSGQHLLRALTATVGIDDRI